MALRNEHTHLEDFLETIWIKSQIQAAAIGDHET